MNLKDLIQFANQDGKVIVAGDDGEVKGVFMSFAEYQRITGSTMTTKQVPTGPDPEKINREILQAQLTDTLDIENKNLEVITEPIAKPQSQFVSPPSPIKNILAKRAKDLFMNQPFGRQEPPLYDLREEVMDPDFDKPLQSPAVEPYVSQSTQVYSQPLVETDSDEEIKPNFDDI
jgi:hypothetical protein